jgi:hypothetical protein
MYIPYEKNTLIHSANMKEHRDLHHVTSTAFVSEDWKPEYLSHIYLWKLSYLLDIQKHEKKKARKKKERKSK